MINNYNAAIEYQKQGLSIYPLSPGTKIPLKGSSGFNDATNDIRQIEEWWRNDCSRNVGLMLKDHGYMVVDLDRHNGNVDGIENMKILWAKYAPFEPTYVEVTPGKGLHYFFKIPEGVNVEQETGAFADIFGRDEDGNSLSGIDIITFGVPIAPTTIIKGNIGVSYQATTGSFKEIAEAPQWLISLLLKQKPLKEVSYRPFTKSNTANKLDLIVQGAGEGGRNDHLTKLAGWLLWHGVDNETLAELIYTANDYNSPPLKDKEVNTIIKSMIKKDLRGRTNGRT